MNSFDRLERGVASRDRKRPVALASKHNQADGSSRPPPSQLDQLRPLEVGRRGEELAAAYLLKMGYHIVAANFALPVGRNRAGAIIMVEIDLVAYDGDVLCFIEVKTRGSDWFAEPQVNVDRRKQRQIARAARAYRRMFDLGGAPFRYDVVTVILPSNDKTYAGADVRLLRNYWTERQFKKRTWSESSFY